MLTSYKTPDAPWHQSQLIDCLINSLNCKTCTQKNEEPESDPRSACKVDPLRGWWMRDIWVSQLVGQRTLVLYLMAERRFGWGFPVKPEAAGGGRTPCAALPGSRTRTG